MLTNFALLLVDDAPTIGLAALVYPKIDPVIFSLGPIAIRWYSLAYLVGFLGGALVAIKLLRYAPPNFTMNKQRIYDCLTWIVLGVIIGGRLGFVIFYQPIYYFNNPAEIIRIWEGGMSFHGGFIGVVIAACLFCIKHKINSFHLLDLTAAIAPIGLGVGRLANFANGELWGRATDMPWGMVFPHVDNLARHPSQIYEAALEGLVLMIVALYAIIRWRVLAKPGLMSGIFVIGYALARGTIELFREPEITFSFASVPITAGQLYSIPLLLVGLGVISYALRPQGATN